MLMSLVTRIGRRPITTAIVALLFTTFLFALTVSPFRERSAEFIKRPWATDVGQYQPPKEQGPTEPSNDTMGDDFAIPSKPKIHIILPATKSNVNMCKTLFTMSILEYPTPHIVAWRYDDKSQGLLGGGSHFAKITRTLEYINDPERRNEPGFDDQLVFMLDAYDVWFQLPLEQLLSRYDDVVAEENERVEHRMGRAYGMEKIHSSVVFGGGKRCAPNLIETLACYPVPASPLPEDLRGSTTDTMKGRNGFSSFRTRFLNSGYLIGPIKDMRRVLERAKVKLEECIDRHGAWFDDGHGITDECYHGSDQSIFVEMFGEQEFQREAMRRHHRTWTDKLSDLLVSGRPGANPPPMHIMDKLVDDFLNPSFGHQNNDTSYQPGKPFEMGIGVDYWSLLGHQTSNADDDSRYIRYNETIEPQIGQQGEFDCPGTAALPEDLPQGRVAPIPAEPYTWDTMPLYSEICVAKVPVMIHHNSGDKAQREHQWDKAWWGGRQRKLFENQRQLGADMLHKGISTDNGTYVRWEELCPREFEPELFRDVTKDEVEGK